MKIGIIGDIHFSEYSSILRTEGKKYSTRLENCIESINWAEEITSDCYRIIYLGDFFDKSFLNSKELTALSEIKWNNCYHEFLVGNHEMGINNLLFSSAHTLKTNENRFIVDKPFKLNLGNCEVCYLPYILEEDRKSSICEYFGKQGDEKRIIFSHNDIEGIQLGKFISKAGFSIEDIEENCDLFINGHLHNGSNITDKIINIGNLTGQNFSEDGFKYEHHIIILDTDTLKYEFYKNPFAINFYKLENIDDIYKVENGVITLKVPEKDILRVKDVLNNNSNILSSRVIVDYNSSKELKDSKLLSVDHLNEFRKFVLKEIGDSDLVQEELDIIDG